MQVEALAWNLVAMKEDRRIAQRTKGIRQPWQDQSFIKPMMSRLETHFMGIQREEQDALLYAGFMSSRMRRSAWSTAQWLSTTWAMSAEVDS